MLNKLIDFTREILSSADFTCIYEQGEPADRDYIEHLEKKLSDVGLETPRSLADFYRTCDGFARRWTYRKLTHPDYITYGATSIVDIDALLVSLQDAPTKPVLFDYISDLNQVLLILRTDNIEFLYHDEYLQQDFPMSIDVDQYFYLLDESRGLYPWQEFFVRSPSFQLKSELEAKFFVDLNLLFKDANSKLFQRELND